MTSRASRHLPPDGAGEVTRQKRAGEASRQRSRERLLQAAAEVFADQGYAGATVTAIAAGAGVSLQTLYTAWGSKRGLLRAHVEHQLTGSATALSDGTWEPRLRLEVAAATQPDPEAHLRRVAAVVREVAARMASTWTLVRDAAAVDPDVAEDHAALERLRRRSMAALLDGLDPRRLRAGLDLDAAVDTALVIAGPGTYDTLVGARGYSPERFERWVADALITMLLEPETD